MAIPSNRVVVPMPALPVARVVDLVSCEACGASVETIPDEVLRIEQTVEPDADGERKYFQIYACQTRECPGEVVVPLLVYCKASEQTDPG